MLKPALLALGLALGLAGCATTWETTYQQLDAAQTAGWRVAAVEVAVPDALTTSEANNYIPDFDIVWHGEPAGDRRVQVAAILREGIEKGAAGLNGKTGVRIVATVSQFHAITPVVRERLQNSGVHNIRYTVQVFDARSGAALSQPQLIKAEFPALVGKAGDEAEARGLTQRVQIVNQIAAVTQNWLGRGADPRGSFQRRGR
ncbi:DUF6778 family protein [Paracoccus denitrificans]|jgi:hypothetical protein|uniref:Lipoprotein n=1 Tax=Paracoccus denitrificans (strain Pd 1222) TaxID=318586 RepID=A1B3I8_PARDP|nr:DUF6778 family protein [Paracoccus denitrificans]ABL70082.1 conserved hypothetical protein [Paracoccus denitrificans PD1222]MBB4628799.1 hypothetical protein [Paracoccus denitrificans]MCU7429818.1 hypothetical protein [Paracoccus denitrificans]QAR25459.1 hypothetical protein EO213_03605 [Paracoccus denitrificans]UFS65342.1 hypothetical protein LO749_01900 [Paracoccus denitrificans]